MPALAFLIASLLFLSAAEPSEEETGVEPKPYTIRENPEDGSVEETLTRDSNGDNQPDIWYFYRNREKIKEERDSDFDGKVDWRFIVEGDERRYQFDRNRDGLMDEQITYKSSGSNFSEIAYDRSKEDDAYVIRYFTVASDPETPTRFDTVLDEDFDGKADRRIERFDRNRDGLVDEWQYHDANDERTEMSVDLDADLIPDKFIYYAQGKVARRRQDTDLDGKVDRTEVFEGELISSVEEDPDGDGIPERTRNYVEGLLTREKLDSDRDGLPDTWKNFEKGRLSEELLDQDGDRQPELRRLYQDGVLTRIERDTTGNGDYDDWTYLEKGQVVREESDTDHNGAVDLWRYYKEDELAKQDWDRNRDGKVDLVQYFADGSLVREERDRDFDGIMDLVTDLSTVTDNGEVADGSEEDPVTEVDPIEESENGNGGS